MESVVAAAVGRPGQRTFYIQATGQGRSLVVLVEKEQVAALAERLSALVEQVAARFPDVSTGEPPVLPAPPDEPPVPLFRALAIGLGFDPGRQLVLLELHERPTAEEDDEGDEADEESEGAEEHHVARLYATVAQARALASRGAEAVAGGRPPCPLCQGPLDPEGHRCPRTNGHLRP